MRKPRHEAEQIAVTAGSARLLVCAHGQKRLVTGLKYEGEDTYRYLVATDLSWRTLDIVQTYTLAMVHRGFLRGLESV